MGPVHAETVAVDVSAVVVASIAYCETVTPHTSCPLLLDWSREGLSLIGYEDGN
jgi:hypothetical protein